MGGGVHYDRPELASMHGGCEAFVADFKLLDPPRSEWDLDFAGEHSMLEKLCSLYCNPSRLARLPIPAELS